MLLAAASGSAAASARLHHLLDEYFDMADDVAFLEELQHRDGENYKRKQEM